METLKINGKEYPITFTGEAVMIAMDELHSDFFRLANTFSEYIANEDVPLMDIIAKLMYCGIKCTNPEVFRNYKLFMQSVRNLGDFTNLENLLTLNKELYASYNIKLDGDEETEEKEETSKKKVTETD